MSEDATKKLNTPKPQQQKTVVKRFSAKLHYTDTGYGHVVQHHQRTSSQQLYNLLYNKFATSQCQSLTPRHVEMLGCGKFLSVGDVVAYSMSVAGFRVVEYGTYKSTRQTL